MALYASRRMIAAIAAAILMTYSGARSDGAEWSQYGADSGGTRYAAARQITPENVTRLTQAWVYNSGHLDAPRVGNVAFQTTPVLAAGSLIFCTPFNEVIALDPATGIEKWRFDPEIARDQRPANQFTCRGVSIWRAEPQAPGTCTTRVLMGTNNAKLYAVDAYTGSPCADFGDGGRVDLKPDRDLLWPGEMQVTSPPVVINNTVVVGSSISDNMRLQAPSGTVRAFDVRTGAPLWDSDPVPRSAEDPAGDLENRWAAIVGPWQCLGAHVCG